MTRLVILPLVLALAGAQPVLGGSGQADENSCSFDAATATVTARIAHQWGGMHGIVLTVKDSRIEWVNGFEWPDSTPCGEATIHNTDTIEVFASGSPSHEESFGLYQSPGEAFFAPGKTPEAAGISEIEIHTHLGGDGEHLGISMSSITPGDDVLVIGHGGIAWTTDGDADVTYDQPSPLYEGSSAVFAYLGGGVGDDTLSGQGGYGTGRFPAARVALNLSGDGGNDTVIGSPHGDYLAGGRGGSDLDFVHGRDGPDRLDLCGNDTLHGGRGNDRFITTCGGGPGPSYHAELFGEGGSDQFLVRNGWPDNVDGGPGADSAQIDVELDTTRSVETLIP